MGREGSGCQHSLGLGYRYSTGESLGPRDNYIYVGYVGYIIGPENNESISKSATVEHKSTGPAPCPAFRDPLHVA